MTTPPGPPLDAAESDPTAEETAAGPGHSAGDRLEPGDAEHPAATEASTSRGQGSVGPPAQDPSGR